MFWKLLKFFLVLLCMISIFLFSSDTADESNLKSNGLIVRVAEFLAGRDLNPKEREEKIEKYVVFVRKAAHFTIFFVLGFLVISFLKEFYEVDWKVMFFAFLFSFLYACSDEVHQLFVPGRSGNIIDVGIDSMGSYFGILLYHIYLRFRRNL